MRIQELADRLDVNSESIRHWRKDGMPCSKDNRGRIEIDEKQVAEWLAKTGKYKHAQKLIKVKRRDNKESKKKLQSMSSSDDLESMLSRCRRAEKDAWDMYQKAEPALVMLAMEQHRNQVEARRKVEKDIAAIRLSQQEVIPRAEIEKTFSNMAVACKGDLLSIPDSIAPQLVGLTAAEISVKVRAAIIDALRHISGVNYGA